MVLKTIFTNIGWIAATATLWKLGLKLNSMPLQFITLAFAAILFAFASYYGFRKILIPFLKTMYGKEEKYSYMERLGFKSMFNIQFLIYILSGLCFFGICFGLLDAIW